ncbi:MAG TPA: aminotransferase class I/II-fold pyridoxal phosphate-dependent enzyme [Spirochaetales bacterium]|nr:aminotransferase class I/II-fold pyridoxal phosphate-dependent enzyme [Spirochaetales bacterium]HRY53948.1 aminotransferase class I/II-fold pyridoxal phosphate-dependent enzyme [Spirochaetia bacterium]HRZ64123.1 aminotransferase class I/II-fold pyridoxal phosphate-dependent enzyme [Spirochaetia bacterium]
MSDAVLRLDANEGRPALGAEAIAAFLGPEALRRYPDARPLEAALARRMGLPPSRVLATAGADDAIDRAVRCLAGPGGTVVSADPTFVEYAAAAARSGSRYAPVFRAPGAPYPVAEALAALGRERAAGRPALAIAASPDNPGGAVLGRAELEELAGSGFPVLLDLTYAAFAEAGVGAGLAFPSLELGGVLVAGSLSKAFGLAGLRIGWACGPEGLVSRLREAGPPYSLSSVAAAAGLAALELGEAALEPFLAEVRRERALLEAALAGLGARSWPGQANFATALVREPRRLAAALASAGVRVRTWPGASGMDKLIRITCPGDRAEFETLVAALEAAKEYA